MTLIAHHEPLTDIATRIASAHWFAVYTAPCREKRVLDHLAMRQIESFLPLYRTPRKWKNRCRVELERPLFPGYVFVRISDAERIRVLEAPGVVSIVGRGRVPEPLEDHTIATLQASIHLRRAEPHPYLVVGEQVSICTGPFAGLSGIVLRQKGSLRVVITLKLLMQSIAVEVNTEDLEPLSQFIPSAYGCARTRSSQSGWEGL
jgi:transcription antitermination factor NusG